MPFHVVVGAGAPGVATARLLAEDGDQVRLITRRGSGPDHPLIDRVAADATDTVRLTELATGASTLFNCAMPAYDQWPRDFPPLAAAIIAAAEQTGSGYVMLGNTYGYGPVDGPLTEDLPMAPITRKGRVRAQMWTDARALNDAGRVRATEVRANDFLGVGAYSPYTLLVAAPVLAGTPAAFPGDLDAPHSWSYAGDVARTLIAAARSDEAWGRAWHVPSVSTVSMRELTARLVVAAGIPAANLSRMSVDEVREIGLGDSIMAELEEILYLYDRPAIVDSSLTERILDVKPSALDDVLSEMAAG
jgi:nucleoside-diphosphate-sugar epimerase